MTEVVGLGGGIGASRLWQVLRDELPDENLTLIVNTGEDVWMHGLRVCPDIDTVIYALSGRQDSDRGWGVKDETWHTMETLATLESRPWFNLGDRDLAVHLFRTGRLREGRALSGITAELSTAMGIDCRILPMSDDEVTSRIGTSSGKVLHYQEFLVREHSQPDVTSIVFDGAEQAHAAPGVLAAIETADVVLIAPSNPIASLGPMLALPDVRKTLVAARERTIAVTPIVESLPIDDAGESNRARSRSKLLSAAGYDPGVAGVAAYYADVASVFVLDRVDSKSRGECESHGLVVKEADTLLHLGADPRQLLDALFG